MTRWCAWLLLLCLLPACGRDTATQSHPALPPEAAASLREAQEALSRRAIPEALIAAERAAEQAPEHVLPLLMQARILLVSHRFDDAETVLRRSEQLNPEHPDVLELLGGLARQQRAYRESLGYYARSADVRPTPFAWQGVGDAYRELHVPDSARTAYERALHHDVGFLPALRALADLELDDGNYARAVEHARAASARSEAVEDVYRYGLAQLKNGEPDAARPLLEAAVRRAPAHAGALFAYGQLLQQTGEHAQAEHVLARAAAAEARAGHILQLRRALQQNPGDFHRYLALTDTLLAAGDSAEARRILQAAKGLAVTGDEARAIRERTAKLDPPPRPVP